MVRSSEAASVERMVDVSLVVGVDVGAGHLLNAIHPAESDCDATRNFLATCDGNISVYFPTLNAIDPTNSPGHVSSEISIISCDPVELMII